MLVQFILGTEIINCTGFVSVPAKTADLDHDANLQIYR